MPGNPKRGLKLSASRDKNVWRPSRKKSISAVYQLGLTEKYSGSFTVILPEFGSMDNLAVLGL